MCHSYVSSLRFGGVCKPPCMPSEALDSLDGMLIDTGSVPS